ncbi:MAG: hypothetical protein Ct9H300mP25_05400 [Acidobacteriota bacterium]|nr:MAG: hypothetical protein Ct9H300mP25_05400 [Acidobacteriota bacterium]
MADSWTFRDDWPTVVDITVFFKIRKEARMNFLRHRCCALLVSVLGLVLSACASDQVEEVAQEPVTELTEASRGSQERRFANISSLPLAVRTQRLIFLVMAQSCVSDNT